LKAPVQVEPPNPNPEPGLLLEFRRFESSRGHTPLDEPASILPGRRHDPVSDCSSSCHQLLEFE
jgi:hypothetical protein